MLFLLTFSKISSSPPVDLALKSIGAPPGSGQPTDPASSPCHDPWIFSLQQSRRSSQRPYAIILILLHSSSLSACQRNTIEVVPKDNTGRIEVSEDIFIDTAAETLTFREGSFVTCGDERIDMSGTTHEISKYMDGKDLFLHPSSKTLSPINSYDNILLGKGLKAKYPDAKIIFFSSPQNKYIDRPASDLAGTQWEGNTDGYNRKGLLLQDYVRAMETVCARYDVPFCSLTEAFPWGAAELGDNEGHAGTYGSDALHPNAEGHDLIAQEMAKFINACFVQ